MRPVRRDEIEDYATYSDHRAEVVARVLAIKQPRRVHVGENLTFLFENTDTVRYQVQEMVRVERIVREAEILHELATYNELLGGPGELGATLLIEIPDPSERDRLLTAWLELPSHLYALLDDGTKVRPTFDARQVGEQRLSSVQYLKFPTAGRVPIGLGSDLPGCAVEVLLTAAQRAALTEDLAT